MDLTSIKFNEEYKSRPIVIVDSGKGGLYILKQLREQFPVENFVLLFDNEYSPYGDKEPKKLRRHFARIAKQLKELNPKAVVIACNTLDAIAGDDYDAIFANIPVFHVIAQTAKKAEELTKNKRIALIATVNTIQSQKYMKFMFAHNINLYALECLNLARAIDENKDVKKVFREEIAPLETIDFDTIILGCTHYHYVIPMVKKLYNGVNVVDSADVLIDEVVEQMPTHLLNQASKQKVYIVMTAENKQIEEEITKANIENAIIVCDRKDKN